MELRMFGVLDLECRVFGVLQKNVVKQVSLFNPKIIEFKARWQKLTTMVKIKHKTTTKTNQRNHLLSYTCNNNCS